jgi:hypothetical protein
MFMFCRSLFVLLSFFFWPLCCLYFFDLRILITLWYLQTLLIQAPNFILNLVCHYINLYTCIFPVHGSDSDSGVGSSVSVVYNTATSMPCDCFETVVKSCYLSYFPVVGCVIAVSSFAGTSTVGIFSYV